MTVRRALAHHHERAVRYAIVAERARRDREDGLLVSAARLDGLARELYEGLPTELKEVLR